MCRKQLVVVCDISRVNPVGTVLRTCRFITSYSLLTDEETKTVELKSIARNFQTNIHKHALGLCSCNTEKRLLDILLWMTTGLSVCHLDFCCFAWEGALMWKCGQRQPLLSSEGSSVLWPLTQREGRKEGAKTYSLMS